MNIYYHHIGEKGANEDFPKTIYSQRPISLIKDAIPESHSMKEAWILRLEDEFPSGYFNCWGVPSGAQSVIRTMAEGDAVLFVESVHWPIGMIPAFGQIKAFFREELPSLSNELWGDPRYPYVFFFDTERLDLSWFEFLEHVGYKENFNPRGMFYRVQDERLDGFGGASGYLNYLRKTHRVHTEQTLGFSKDDLSYAFVEEAQDFIVSVKSNLDSLAYNAETTLPRLTDESSPQETIVRQTPRSAAFRYAVQKVYSEKCAVCGLSAKSPKDDPEVESSHIYPKAMKGSDDIRNGICLCRFHHWAFDCGWFTISDDYQIIVREDIPDRNDYSEIRKYNGSQLRLPKNPNLRPHYIFLKEHRKLHGFE